MIIATDDFQIIESNEASRTETRTEVIAPKVQVLVVKLGDSTTKLKVADAKDYKKLIDLVAANFNLSLKQKKELKLHYVEDGENYKVSN